MGAKSGCAACHAQVRTKKREVRAVSERARIELTGHLNKSRCALAAGIAFRWEWGWGRYPPATHLLVAHGRFGRLATPFSLAPCLVQMLKRSWPRGRVGLLQL